MDMTTLLGILTGILLIINGIGTGKLDNFLDLQSVMIVVGGTLAATVASYPPSILMDIPKHMKVLIRGNRFNIPKLVEQLVDMSMVARKGGLLALEDMAEELDNTFFRQSVLMVVDAHDPEKVRQVLERELENMMMRHDQVAGMYEKASAYAPAFGMIGTLIGLINMLKGLDLATGGGTSLALGTDMSIALITTLYGSILSNLLFHPIAKKLRIRQDAEELFCSTIIVGVIAIQKGENPKMLREQLLVSIKQSQRVKILAQTDNSGRTEERDVWKLKNKR